MKDHEEVMDLTHKLDTDWKELLPAINQMTRTEAQEKPEMDDYDRLVKEMIFSPRGEPTEKLKTEEDLARIEKEKLEKLEKERLQRMKGDEEIEEEAKSNYRSADDLDDGYFLEPVIDDGDKVISYPINEEAENEVEEEQEEEEEERSIIDEEENHDEEEESQSGEEEESEDDLEDLKEDSSDSELEESEKEEKPIKKSQEKQSKEEDSLPFTIQLPESYEKFTELLENRSIKLQVTIFDRIIKTNHPKLHFSNRQKMLKLFAFLLQYINDLFTAIDEKNISKHFKLLNNLLPHLYDLSQMNPEECSKSFLEVIKEKYENYSKSPKSYPKMDTLIFFKIVGALFPTSDFRHPVVTPSFVFLHQILSQSKIKSRFDVTAGLFLSTLVLDFQKISRRFLPAVMNFLNGVCYLGVKKSLLDNIKPIPPFKRMDELLVLNEKFNGEISELTSKDFVNSIIDDDFKVRALNVTSGLMLDFTHLYKDIMGFKYFLSPIQSILMRLTKERKLPTKLIEKIEKMLNEDFKKLSEEKKFKYPEPAKKIIPMLRLLEPRFETVSTDRRSMYCQAEGNAAEKKKLQHMYKREFKAAKRELRRDNEFVSKIRQKRRQQTDFERKEKVKRIFNEASTQQHEFKAMARTKGRKNNF